MSKLHQIIFLIIMFVDCCAVKQFNAEPVQHGRFVYEFGDCRDTTITRRVKDTIILNIRNELGGGGYLLQIDSTILFSQKGIEVDKKIVKIYEYSEAVIRQYTIIPIRNVNFLLPVSYKRPFEPSALKRCLINFNITR